MRCLKTDAGSGAVARKQGIDKFWANPRVWLIGYARLQHSINISYK